MAANNGKDTIYVDIDDEITGIIDKVRSSNEKIVALVLPKRAAVLQSVVNMKLLKRTAESAKKSLVLITTEAGLLPLAASVGLHVAKNLQSKPAIPVAETDDETADEVVDVDDTSEVTTENAGHKPIGELAGAAGAAALAGDGIETLNLDDDEEPAADADAKPKTKKVGNKKLHIPNFDAFRLRLFLGVLLFILLIVGWFFASSVLPKATITITTDTSDINSSLNLTVDSKATALDTKQLVIPAQVKSEQKSASQQVATTGQKNQGTQATGTVTMTARECYPNFGQPDSVSGGTGISSGGINFITQDVTKFNNAGVVSGSGTSACITYQATGTTDVTAQTGGTKYNVSSATFTVAGRSDVSATGSASGGTDNIVQVVAQADIDSASKKISSAAATTVQTDLQTQLQKAGLYPLTSTFLAGTPTVTNSANVGDAASTVTVTQVTTYTMLGVKQADLKTLVDNDVKTQIDPNKQSVLTEGLDTAVFHAASTTATSAQGSFETTATAGPDLTASNLKTQVAGKKSGEVQTLLKANPGVSNVTVHLSPFWVSSVPKKASKITIIFQKAATPAKTTSNANNP